MSVPAHCELIGRLQERQGELGQRYAIRFHLRLPENWNGRLYFQGGGGSNGELGSALGEYPKHLPSALTQGYAVVSQDSGHNNATNADPSHGGSFVFGFDPVARRNYGYASLPPVSEAAKAAVNAFYGKLPAHSYFVGCSKGGEEGLALAERYPDQFEGIVVGAPGMSLPRAALAEAWDTQQFARLIHYESAQAPAFRALHSVFTDQDFAQVRAAVLAACDSLDGAQDGLVLNTGACTTARVLPELRRRSCPSRNGSACIDAAKIEALTAVMEGAHDSKGHALYSDWAWDPGISSTGWRTWKIGAASGMPPALNVVLGAGALATVFTVPPVALSADPQALFEWQLGFSFDRDAPKISAKDTLFTETPWADVSARSSDLDGWRRHGGHLLVWHGVADPVFSFKDTASWWQEVHQRYKGAEAGFLRLFAVPGLNHCGGGDATGEFDALAAIVAWVESGRPPNQLIARAGPNTPWPGRERPLCAWPKTAQYTGHGSIERAENFACR